MSSNLQLLQELVAKPSVVNWFRGLFERLYLEIEDTGERFTATHLGDRVDVVAGYKGSRPNLVIPLHSENVANLTAHFADDVITPQEEYRIVKFMIQPCIKAAMAMPILNHLLIRMIVRVDSHWQEALLDPQGNEDEQLTVIHVNGQWLVIPGYYGKPKRRLVFTPHQMIEFQRRVLAADHAGKLSEWVKLALWYRTFRKDATVPV